ncbi:MAG: transcription termination/antitermination NusG family protein [Verrucomicrobiota bacterium]|nr:transcription termination/antitermination NusG family protein [Verrucomicrobiota bacterium]
MAETTTLSELFFDPCEESIYAVAHVRPRCEKRLSEVLKRKGVGYYLPHYIKRLERRSGKGRVRTYLSDIPLFPGYVFLHFCPDFKSDAQICAQVVSWIMVSEKEKPRLMSQLNSIRISLETPFSFETFPHLKVGNPIVITTGPLKGCEGIVGEHLGNRTFSVNVDMLGRSITVNVDGHGLRPLD